MTKESTDPLRYDRTYGETLLYTIEEYFDGRLYIKDDVVMIGVSCITLDIIDDTIYITGSDCDAFPEGQFFSTFEALFNGIGVTQFALSRKHACQGNFTNWKEYCQIIDGTVKKSLGEI